MTRSQHTRGEAGEGAMGPTGLSSYSTRGTLLHQQALRAEREST